LLAGLVKNPYGYDPTKFPDKALERRNVVLERMAQLSVVPQAKAEKNKQKDLGLHVQEVDNGCVNSTGAVLLRLRHQLPAPGRGPGVDRPAAPQRAEERRPDDQDHARPERAA
jgi:membrane peptidoglycan carboxypeptidase